MQTSTKKRFLFSTGLATYLFLTRIRSLFFIIDNFSHLNK